MICRWAEKITYRDISKARGYVIVFKNILLQPGFSEEVFTELRNIRIHVAVYERPPRFLVDKLISAAYYVR